MRRIILSVAAVSALALSGLFSSTAQAQGPYVYRAAPHYRYSNAHVYSRYSPHQTYGHHATPILPYGAGYAGGYQPHQGGLYLQQPRFGLYLGF